MLKLKKKKKKSDKATRSKTRLHKAIQDSTQEKMSPGLKKTIYTTYLYLWVIRVIRRLIYAMNEELLDRMIAACRM